jgi:predicted nuclease with TOPRIM domain
MTDETKDVSKELETVKAQLAEATKGLEALKAKNEELLGETKAAKAARREAEEAAKKEAEELARKSGDVQALEKSWQEKMAKREKELLDQTEGLTGQVRSLTVGRTATDLAAELAVQGSAKALLPHIERRLSMDIRDGKPVVVVLDVNGKPSAATVDELKKEISGDAAFAPLIVASKASGGGASGGKGGGAAKQSVTRTAFEAMTDASRMDHVKSGGLVTD